MKRFLVLLSLVTLFACSEDNDPIPAISVFTPLTVEQLSPIVKTDTAFATFYQELRKEFDQYEDVEKARFDDVTYRGFYHMYRETKDTVLMNNLVDTYKKEWDSKFLPYVEQADTLLDRWQAYKEEHSLNKFVNITLSNIECEYYQYSGDLREVYLVFMVTPLEENISAICFNYRYPSKESSSGYVEHLRNQNHECYASGLDKTVVVREAISYSDRDNVKNLSVEDFLSKFDLQVDVEWISTKDDLFSMDRLPIPERVATILKETPDYRDVLTYSKAELIKEEFCKEFVLEYDYIYNRTQEYFERKYPREYALVMYITRRKDTDK